MKKYKIKKLFKGYASVRNYVVENCIIEKKPLQITYGKQIMTIFPENLTKFIQLNKQIYGSIFDNNYYRLYDYYFVPDKREE
jgi:hypothetical protein